MEIIFLLILCYGGIFLLSILWAVLVFLFHIGAMVLYGLIIGTEFLYKKWKAYKANKNRVGVSSTVR